MKPLLVTGYILLTLAAFPVLYWVGFVNGRASVVIPPCPPPKVVWTAPSTEELGRMYRARVRMERVK
jgi:hypothetical protein